MKQNTYQNAQSILYSCQGKTGIFASPDRYRLQCWTRDFVVAVLGVLVNGSAEQRRLAQMQFNELARRQESNGQIPILYLEQALTWAMQKTTRSVHRYKKHGTISFMLKHFLRHGNVNQLTPWTRDSEVLYILGVATYYRITGDHMWFERHIPHIDRALRYIKNELVSNHLIYGSDWRDSKPEYTRSYLLTMQCWLYRAYSLLGMEIEADALKETIRDRFWVYEPNEAYFRDRLGTNEFDTLGNALAILYGVAHPDQYESIITKADSVCTPYGYKLDGVTLPPTSQNEREQLSRTPQNWVIWPWIHYYMVLALIKAGKPNRALEEFAKMERLEDFREFYLPDTGEGGGSYNQLWSACMHMQAHHALQNGLPDAMDNHPCTIL